MGYSVAFGVVTLMVVTACGSSAKVVSPSQEDLRSEAKISVSPKTGTNDAPISTEIAYKVSKGKFKDLKLTNAKGKEVKGHMRSDGSSFVPDEPLDFGTKYVASVTAVDGDDISGTKESTFTTMSAPGNTINGSLWNGDGKTFGKAMPILLDFPRSFSVPEDKRASVEKRLFVSSKPKQVGAWHWFSGNHLEYRPKDFWKPGTKINVRYGLAGLPLGGGVYGSGDVTATVNIDTKDREVHVSNKDKNLKATEDGKTVKTMDVSLGKDAKPSYSGTMAIMEKKEKTTFDTTDEPECHGKEGGENCYKAKIKFAQRLTWSGQFIHSAPWSVADQGHRNVSHGCVNVSDKNAEWIFNFTDVGTPVIIEGTGHNLPAGDGFTAYNLSWDDFLKGSYLPAPKAEK
jgi:lipoprotein-anchoring transpeptidase ErfK/SrfK